jgi:hypothetical protein
MSNQEVVHVHQRIPGGNLKESFSWAPEEYIRFLIQTEAGSIYRVRAIHVTDINAPESTLTRNGVEFTEEELKAAARSLGYRPLDLNHEPPILDFPANRVIDAEFEDATVEALIAVRDTGVMSMIEAKKITAVSIMAQYRWADVLCDPEKCWLRPTGIIFTGLGLLTPGVQPGDPLASIIMKKVGKPEPLAPTQTSSPVTGTTVMVDTTPNLGGVLMEKKEATPPLEPAKEATPPPPQAAAPTQTEADGKPVEVVKVEVDASKALDQVNCAKRVLEVVSEMNTTVKKLDERMGSLETHVKLLEQQRKGTRRTTPNT